MSAGKPPFPELTVDFSRVALRQAPDNLVLWRYLSLEKLVLLLSIRQLPMIHLQRFEDPFEATMPAGLFSRSWGELAGIRKHISSAQRAPFVDDTALGKATDRYDAFRNRFNKEVDFVQALRRSTYATCWYEGDESEAMWRLYCSTGGVAIKTTAGKLHQVVTNGCPQTRFTHVEYYEKNQRDYPGDDLLYSVFYKRWAFRHEREYRGLYVDPTLFANAMASPDLSPELKIDSNATATRNLPFRKPSDLIDGLVVSPYAPSHFSSAVLEVVRAFDPGIQITSSDLNGIRFDQRL